MITQELIGYIKKELANRKTKEEIVNVLLTQGWSDSDLEEAFKQIVAGISVGDVPESKNLGSINDGNINHENQTIGSEIKDLPSSSSLLKESFSFYKKRFKTLLGISFLLTFFVFVYDFFAIKDKLSLIKDFNSLFSPENILFILITILLFFIQIWIYLALIFAIKDSEEEINIIEALKRAKNKIFPMFLVSILFFLTTIGGSFLFIIPGIILFISLSFFPFIVVSENLGGFNALVKSREYVKGYWWRILRKILFIPSWMILFYLLALFLLFISKLLLGNSMLFDGIYSFAQIFNYLLSFVFFPLFIIFPFLVYQKMRVIKNNFISTSSKKIKLSYIALSILTIAIFSGSFFFLNKSSNFLELNQEAIQNDLKSENSLEIEIEKENETLSPNDSSIIATSNNWKEYVYQNEGFSVNFISEPQIESQILGSEKNTANVKFFECQNPALASDIKYSVDYWIFHKNIYEKANSIQEKELIGINFLKGMLSLGYGNMVSFKDSSDTEGHKTVSFFINSSPTRYEGKMIALADRVYIISGECQKCESIPDLQSFLNSFKLLK